MTDKPVDLEHHRMMRELRGHLDAEMEVWQVRMSLLCGRWGLKRHPLTLAAFKLAEAWFDDFPKLCTETELANAVFFFHRFCLRFPFDDLNAEAVSRVWDDVTPGMRLPEIDPQSNEPVPIDDFEYDAPREDEKAYTWAVAQLGLADKPYWAELDAAIDEMVKMHGALPDDHAEYLMKAITTIRHVAGQR